MMISNLLGSFLSRTKILCADSTPLMRLRIFNDNGGVRIFTVVANGYMNLSDLVEIFLNDRVVGN